MIHVFQLFPSLECKIFALSRLGARRATETALGVRKNLRYSLCMTETEKAILCALLELDSAVKTMRTANPKPNLLPLFSRLDDLMRQLPPSAPPDLLHYLHKKSYEKALLFLQGREAENTKGSCRH